MRITYLLHVDLPDEADMEPWLHAEIEHDAEPHDTTWQAKVERWLGGYTSAPAEDMARDLPEGIGVRIDAA